MKAGFDIGLFKNVDTKLIVRLVWLRQLMDPLTAAVLLIGHNSNTAALLSGSDQPVRKLGRLRILYVRRENKRSKTATFAQWYMVHC